MSVSINGTSGLVFNDASTQSTAATGFGFKNRIINGAMVISQRNGTSSVTPASGDFIVDRFKYLASQASKVTAQQNAGSVTPPAGFTNYLGFTSSSSYSVGASEVFETAQFVEGYNVADLNWGTANAKTVTLSFWVRSSLTGTFGGYLANDDQSRSYVFSYTISSANTWEQKSVTIAGDTSGTWLTTNGNGLRLNFSMGAGSSVTTTAGSWGGTLYRAPTGQTSVVGTNGATFYITGVQLEKGSTATSFDYRPYGTELALCQRYYYRNTLSGGGGSFGLGTCNSTSQFRLLTTFPVTMRTAPTALEYSGVPANYQIAGNPNGDVQTAIIFSSADTQAAITQGTQAGTALIAGNSGYLRPSSSTAVYLAWSAEL